MEVWIGTDNNRIKLPITPAVLGVQRNSDIKTDSIIKLGEVDSFSGMKLKTIDLEGFFPNQDYSFASSNRLDPYEYSDIFQRWMYNGTILRVVVTDTPTNMLCRINKFNTDEQDGTRDLYFELGLTEHKPKYIPGLNNLGNSNSNASRPISSTSSNKGSQRTHKVVKGDNLWDLAHKYYGKGSDYHKIKNANKSKYPSLNHNNVIYPNWILIVP